MTFEVTEKVLHEITIQTTMPQLSRCSRCKSCGAKIKSGDKYYDVYGKQFRISCKAHAERAIINNIIDDYTFEM